MGVVICDEGHRLKNYKSQLFKAVAEVDTSRRLLLSGTPIQNNLDEIYSLVSFVNPKVWESYQEFREFARSIERSMDFSVSEKTQYFKAEWLECVKFNQLRSKGEEATDEIRKVLNQFLLQRTNEVMRKYLPKKSEYVVFCRLNALQEQLYEAMENASEEGNGGLNALGFLACGILCKLCNHPTLIYEAAAEIAGVSVPPLIEGDINVESANVVARRASSRKNAGNKDKKGGSAAFNPEHSSKCKFVINLLLQLKQKTDDKVVIVSVYVETLTLLSRMLTSNKIQHLRLDGSVPTKKRQVFVDQFNDAKSGYMVLLLSNRAGGCGLNLIGGNRLIMYDPDWNPANDAQAMARVWRSGQKKPTYIYRLLSTGTIEEKMFQRQTFKADMAEQIIAAQANDVTAFVVKELKAIFSYNNKTLCDTIDKMKGSAGLVGWDRHPTTSNVGDVFLTQCSRGIVTYLLKRIVNDEKDKKVEENTEQSEDKENKQNNENVEEAHELETESKKEVEEEDNEE
ncbi:SNF2 family domain-containing protein [Reticulomyxa filosa]|uniref:SNF2 family domain-containing protein n=1 Tax=Reticulomyxa filosa TaxID=46433 RepID=X6NKM4_RETFI|nr:SNF2 family domain-containing protein [Reticulomyxa filosa]|eukprot:ETO26541.1 SNF2 family domain-containing protein [Reticulomyxa filosa]